MYLKSKKFNLFLKELFSQTLHKLSDKVNASYQKQLVENPNFWKKSWMKISVFSNLFYTNVFMC